MFGVSFGEIAIIVIVALLVFGPDKLPEMAAQAARLLGQLRRSSDELKREFMRAVEVPLAAPPSPPSDTSSAPAATTKQESNEPEPG